MYYTNFSNNITRRYGIVIKNWPLKRFCGPNDLGTKLDVQTLLNSWTTGVTSFYKMSEEELADWIKDRDASPTSEPAMVTVPGGEANVSAGGAAGAEGEHTDDGSMDATRTSAGSTAVSTAPPTPAGVQPSSAPPPTPAQEQPPATLHATTNFVNSSAILGMDGQAMMMVAKQRKQRSDAGKKRKPKAAASENGGSAPPNKRARTRKTA